MAHKRPFDDEVLYEVSSKHPRQDGPSDLINSCNESFLKEDGFEKPYDSGEDSIGKDELEFGEERENGGCAEILRKAVEDTETNLPRSGPSSHWAISSSSEEDEPPELVHLPFFPGYFDFDRPVKSTVNSNDVYYRLLDYPPRKLVPVGPEHQADVPVWTTQQNYNTSDGLENTDVAVSGNNSVGNDSELDGICIVLSPETEPPPFNAEKVGDGKTHCICLDQGSIRCVQQHIIEARAKLRRTLGDETFTELGFDDMGEIASEKWSKEEEQLFHDIVDTNPASLGKNFWYALSAVFPSRTKMEIVSYYYNVFMLRKRAEQNRCDPMNVDSDNDEWQASEDDEEDDDSGIESPVHCDNVEYYDQNRLFRHEQGQDHDDDDDGDISDEAREPDENYGERRVRKSDLDFPGKKPNDDDGENDGQDGSCMSSDSGAPVQGPQLKLDGCREWHEFIFESCNAKAWDGYNMSCPKSDFDFLPTCSMIEEVFGHGDFDKGKR